MPDSGGQTNVQISGKAALFVGKHGSATVMLVSWTGSTGHFGWGDAKAEALDRCEDVIGGLGPSGTAWDRRCERQGMT
jgi:hypothetical protein